jgi:hypothetical protein
VESLLGLASLGVIFLLNTSSKVFTLLSKKFYFVWIVVILPVVIRLFKLQLLVVYTYSTPSRC